MAEQLVEHELGPWRSAFAPSRKLTICHAKIDKATQRSL